MNPFKVISHEQFMEWYLGLPRWKRVTYAVVSLSVAPIWYPITWIARALGFMRCEHEKGN